MRVASVAADQIRSLTGIEVELDPKLTAVVGPNGVGKTNLIEAIYFGLTGRSFRTGDRRDLIPFGETWARSRIRIESDHDANHEFMASVGRDRGTRLNMDGAPIDRAAAIAHRPMVTVFSPDRLEIVKGPPASRRAHLDTWIGARWPSRAETRSHYGRALAQRNALLIRIDSGRADRAQLTTWNRQVAETGAALTRIRQEAVSALTKPYEQCTSDLGLEGENALIYRPGSTGDREELERGLEERLEADLRLGRTSWGPHHDEVRLELNGRQLRRFGSQGQQRLGLLSLLFAERAALLEGAAAPPLMLLDDVMSELDEHRRERLTDLLFEGGQSVMTAAESELVPKSPGLTEISMSALTGKGRRTDHGEPKVEAEVEGEGS